MLHHVSSSTSHRALCYSSSSSSPAREEKRHVSAGTGFPDGPLDETLLKLGFRDRDRQRRAPDTAELPSFKVRMQQQQLMSDMEGARSCFFSPIILLFRAVPNRSDRGAFNVSFHLLLKLVARNCAFLWVLFPTRARS